LERVIFVPTKVRIVLNSDGIKALLQSDEILDDMRRRAENVADAAGGQPDYVADAWVGFDRARATVHTATHQARSDEANNRTLTRSVDAARHA
jgi:hypothetical protein